MTNRIFGKETYSDIKGKKPKFAILPIGSYEQHGAHLPMVTDTLIACAMSNYIAKEYGGITISPITVSCSQEHSAFCGTAWISAKTLLCVLEDIVDSLKISGIEKIVIVNGHGGNYVVNSFAQERNLQGPNILLLPAKQHQQHAFKKAGIVTTPHEDMHGGEYETSIMLSEFPDYVKKDEIQDHSSPERPLLTLLGMSEYTESGIIGFPSLASPEKGALFLQEITKAVSTDLKRFLSLS